MSKIGQYENTPVRTYQDARKYLVDGSIIIGADDRLPYIVEIVKHANGHDIYGYVEDGIGSALMLEGSPYEIPGGGTEEYVTLYTPQ